MKKILFIFTILLFCGCQQEDLIDTEAEVASVVMETRATSSQVFDWETNQKIDISGYGKGIVLPWYNAGSSHLPFYITKNYTKKDGWEMFYNFCTDPNELQKNRYYLMFYNMFTGMMRVYYFNATGTTGGSTTLWSTSLDKSTSLLNATGYFAEPISTPRSNPIVYISNISANTAKAITPLWNAYDIEFAYDPNFDARRDNLHMSIGGYDVNTASIKIEGDISLNSEGTMISKGNLGASSTPQQNIANSLISAVGGSAMELVKGKVVGTDSSGNASKSFFPNLAASAIGAIASGGTSELLKYGVNLVFGSFLGRGSQPQSLELNSDINLKTNGTLTISGTIESNSSANISGITSLLMPGATATTYDRLQPAYNKTFGVWNLTEDPIVQYSDETIWVSYRYSENSWGDYSQLRNLNLKSNSINVKINPAVLENIEKYTVDSEMVLYAKFQGDEGLNKVRNISNEKYTAPKTIIPFFNDPTKGAETIIYRNVSLSYASIPAYPETAYLPYGSVRWNRPGDDRNIRVYGKTGGNLPTDDVAIKVTVTLYPKAPYNTTPIISTRTYLPKFEKTQGTFDYMKSF